jgi:glycosyltransferase involved in cell wall biosynthesis
MFSGTLDNTRGVDRFLSTIPEIPDENVRFWISGVGTVNQKSCVEQTVERMCDSRITFYGTMSWEQYKEKISSADIFVNFQKPNQKISEYTFPSKILDYLSAGGIVVSTRMGDLEHALGDILVFVDNDVMAMRNGIKRAVQSTKHGNDKQEQAQNWIVNNCTYSDFYDKLQKIYQRSK